jgi:hypothetical protein
MAYGSRNFQREGPNPRRTDFVDLFGDLFCSLLETFTPQLSFCCPISSSHAVSATLSAIAAQTGAAYNFYGGLPLRGGLWRLTAAASGSNVRRVFSTLLNFQLTFNAKTIIVCRKP